ncbi:neurocan core protein-like [Ostrea edulis]|uniref:neurocan core protein-like n=1 Tax=Ostrea edulis TaxID=37623 RepID=UPI0024AF99A3|nr:neurocan core protein-like [Ostrea edulis]
MCTSGPTTFSCQCADGFIGNTCKDIDHCASSPCKNNGMCTSGPTTFSCQCADGFIGNTCKDIDHCASSPCKNNGMCTSGPTTFSCQCADGFIGDTCRRCPSSWIEYQGHCYYLDEKRVNWTDAKLECRKRGSHLVEIEDQEKSKWLASTFLVKSTCPTYLYKCTAWTGGNDVDIEGQYRWSYSNAIFTFHFWQRGEPSVGYPKQAEERDCIDLLRNGKWNDRRCSYLNLFICEMSYGQYN